MIVMDRMLRKQTIFHVSTLSHEGQNLSPILISEVNFFLRKSENVCESWEEGQQETERES